MTLSGSLVRVIEGRLAEALEAQARHAAPYEAVGLLTADDRIIELPNRSSDPLSNFEIYKVDILSAITREEIEGSEGLTLWHSHPSGGVGPSGVDMRQKIPYFDHLVVTLTDTDAVFTWY
jgi:proteasome lid subunit RPN8/RPN11